MATLPKAGAVTLLDFAKSINPDGTTAAVVELLNQTNEVLDDMLWIEGNLPTGHRSTIRTGLPTVVWRQLYGGVPPSKSIRAQVDDSCGMLEARSEVDKDIAELNGNTAAFRLSEADSFLESMNQTFVQTLFYGDTSVNPERFLGLSARYGLSTATNGQNIIKAGGATANNNNSIWLIGWGENTITGIFPKGSSAGLVHQDLGEIDAFDSSNNRFRAYADRFQWKCGLAVRDWRYAVRICNIDQTNLLTDTGGTTFKLIELMIKAQARIPALKKCRPVFYVNRTISEMLKIQAMNKSTAALSLTEGADQFGNQQFVTNFMGIPIRMCDQLLTTEALVS
jgi:hypothetical protein